MSRYRYTGPLSAATLPDGTELVLITGAVVDLPAGPLAEDLAGLGRLAAVADDPVPTSTPEPARISFRPEPRHKPKKGGA